MTIHRMPELTIRNLPSAVLDELAARAAREGKSTEAYARELLMREANVETIHEVTERVRKRVEGSGVRLSIEDILAARDADRR